MDNAQGAKDCMGKKIARGQKINRGQKIARGRKIASGVQLPPLPPPPPPSPHTHTRPPGVAECVWFTKNLQLKLRCDTNLTSPVFPVKLSAFTFCR